MRTLSKIGLIVSFNLCLSQNIIDSYLFSLSDAQGLQTIRVQGWKARDNVPSSNTPNFILGAESEGRVHPLQSRLSNTNQFGSTAQYLSADFKDQDARADMVGLGSPRSAALPQWPARPPPTRAPPPRRPSRRGHRCRRSVSYTNLTLPTIYQV